MKISVLSKSDVFLYKMKPSACIYKENQSKPNENATERHQNIENVREGIEYNTNSIEVLAIIDII